MKETKNIKILHVAVDTEFTDTDFVSLQLSIRDGQSYPAKAFFVNSDLLNTELTTQCEKFCEELNITFIPTKYEDTVCTIYPFLESVLETHYPYELIEGYSFKFYFYFFYSAKDFWYAFGFNNVSKYFTKEVKRKQKNFITQKRSIFGNFPIPKPISQYKIRIKLRDLKGYTNRGLSHLASSLNIQMDDKGLMDEYKTCMDVGFQKDPINFIKYGMNDCDVLHTIYLKQLKNINLIMEKHLKMPSYLHFTETDLPVSTGKLVSTIFDKFLFDQKLH
jgi:hypothetical protein